MRYRMARIPGGDYVSSSLAVVEPTARVYGYFSEDCIVRMPEVGYLTSDCHRD